MRYHFFTNNYWQQIFEDNGLAHFDNLWALDTDWFENPNYRRNGWSGVIRHELKTDNGTIEVFIKRQENHNCRTLLHPFRGIPTYRREMQNIIRLTKAKIPSLNLVYYGERKIDGKDQAIIITEALLNYQSLESFFADKDNRVHADQINNLMKITAALLFNMHAAHFRHGSLYPKHLFINQALDDVRIIDLERLKRLPFQTLAIKADMERLIRRHRPIPATAMKALIAGYLQAFDNNNPGTRSRRQIHAFLNELLEHHLGK